MRIGVMGATGLVGTELLRLLAERTFPVDELRVYASPRSEGRKLRCGDREVTCEVLRDGCFDGLELVIVDVDDPISLEWTPQAVGEGAKVIDKSSAFRMDPDVPLVIAEVNPEDMRTHAEGHRVVPELHDDGSRDGTCTASPRRAHRPHGRVDVPVGVRRRARRASTSSTRNGRSSTAASTDLAPRRHLRPPARRRRGVVEADRRQRHPARGFGEGAGLHVGGVEDGARDAQDPPRRRDPVHGHVRAGPRVRRTRGECQRALPPTDEQGRSGRPAGRRAGRAARRRRRRLPDAAGGAPVSTTILVGRIREDPSEPGTLDICGSPATTS